MTSTQDLRKILIFGAGSIGLRHFRILQTLGYKNIAFLRTKRGSSGLDAERNFDVPVFYDETQAFAWGPTDALIANPTSLHLRTSQLALDHGCNVFIEKPVSHSLEGLDHLEKTALEKNKKVRVGCQMRFHPLLLKLKEDLATDKLGTVIYVNSEVGSYLPDWHIWEDFHKSYAASSALGGGVVLTLIHEIDYLYWLFGPFAKLSALGGSVTPLNIQAEDLMLGTFQSLSGIRGQLRMDFWRKPQKRKLEIVATNGEAFLDFEAGTLEYLDRENNKTVLRIPPSFTRDEMHSAALKDFFEQNPKQQGTFTIGSNLKEARQVLEAALLFMQSIQEDGKVLNWPTTS